MACNFTEHNLLFPMASYALESVIGMLLFHLLQLKCHPYYPTGSENDGDDEMEFPDVGLVVTFVEERESNSHYTARILQLTDVAVSKLFNVKCGGSCSK